MLPLLLTLGAGIMWAISIMGTAVLYGAGVYMGFKVGERIKAMVDRKGSVWKTNRLLGRFRKEHPELKDATPEEIMATTEYLKLAATADPSGFAAGEYGLRDMANKLIGKVKGAPVAATA